MRAVVTLALVHGAASQLYPAYCGKDMNLNTIQPLKDDARAAQLVQVQLVVRHGARAPCFADKCWKEYDEEWNCNAREIVRPQFGRADEALDTLEFSKVFTAAHNIRRGNCSLGQLIDQGFRQEVENAKSVAASICMRDTWSRNFKKAYIGAANGLFGATESVDLTNTADIYFESSDIPRTLQSGQIIAEALFPSQARGKAVPWHTQDLAVSTYFPNAAMCPALAHLNKQWSDSPEFYAWKTNPANLELDLALDEKLVTYSPASLYDCLMTSKCTDRPIPFSDELFDLIVKREETTAIMQYLYEDRNIAKLGMKAFLESIVRRLQAATSATTRPLRLALYGAHDTTIMALLAALGGEAWLKEWAPYASHVIFELYRLTATQDYAVRILYQGQPLLLGNCTSELCPLDNLAKLVATMPDCDLPALAVNNIVVKHVPMMLMLVFGIALGGAVGFIISRRYFQRQKEYPYQRLD
ncbi:Aste57867_21261 [Aphanomyces stellatus]|uniref:Aste57867_21261 protein n=1 Tax=Aphanomyces stellatus TaxID=120398 RepID=A0A485LIC2_9STRA|nr:hypothetical protein As57867_021192 [Aphanomyces stellatus]VFT97933.1 Aste57867_21261 [Aphanomyces stellatus]